MNCYLEHGIYEVRYILKNNKAADLHNSSFASVSNSQAVMTSEAGVPQKDKFGSQIKGKFSNVLNKIQGGDATLEYNPNRLDARDMKDAKKYDEFEKNIS